MLINYKTKSKNRVILHLFALIIINLFYTNLYSCQIIDSSINRSLFAYQTVDKQTNQDEFSHRLPKFDIHLGLESSTFFQIGINYRVCDNISFEFNYSPLLTNFIFFGSPLIVYSPAINWQFDNTSNNLIKFQLPYYYFGENENASFNPSISYVWSTASVKSGHLKFILGVSNYVKLTSNSNVNQLRPSINFGVQFCLGFGQ